MNEPKQMKDKIMWAYFAADGWIQVWTMGETKKEANWALETINHATPQLAKSKGWTLKKIRVNVEIL